MKILFLILGWPWWFLVSLFWLFVLFPIHCLTEVVDNYANNLADLLIDIWEKRMFKP